MEEEDLKRIIIENKMLNSLLKNIYVINLDRRKDKYTEFCSRLSEFFDISLIHRFSAIDGLTLKTNNKRKGEVGCNMSYRQLWKSIIDDDYILDDDLIMTFEDDVFINNPENFINDFSDSIIKFKLIEEKNKLLYIGGRFDTKYKLNHNNKWIEIVDNIYLRNIDIDNFLAVDRTTHVLVYTKSMIRMLYKFHLENEVNAIDKFIIKCHRKPNIHFYEYHKHLFHSPINYKTDIQL